MRPSRPMSVVGDCSVAGPCALWITGRRSRRPAATPHTSARVKCVQITLARSRVAALEHAASHRGDGRRTGANDAGAGGAHFVIEIAGDEGHEGVTLVSGIAVLQQVEQLARRAAMPLELFGDVQDLRHSTVAITCLATREATSERCVRTRRRARN